MHSAQVNEVSLSLQKKMVCVGSSYGSVIKAGSELQTIALFSTKWEVLILVKFNK